VLVLAVIALSLFSYIRISRGGETPAYIDLTKCSAYARYGFDIDSISARPDTDKAWVDFYADGSPRGSKPLTILNSGLPGLPEKTFMTSFQKPNFVEMTILIRVYIPEKQMAYINANTDSPQSLYLAGIANNWQIYLNGYLAHSEWHVDDEGNITLPSARNGVNIPIRASLFKVGDNYFAFRLIGNANTNDVGFWLTSPYYVEDYNTIFRQHADIILVILVGVYIMISIYHLMIFAFDPEDKINLVYALASLCSALYGITRTQYIYLLLRNSYITSHLEITALYFMVPLFGFFLDMAGHDRKIGAVSKIYGAFCLLLTVVGYFTETQFLTQWQVVTMVYLVYTFFYRVLYKMIAECRKNGFIYVMTETILGSSVFAAAIVIFCAVVDLLSQLFSDTMVGLTNYALLMFIVGMSFSIGRQSSLLQTRIRNLNIILERSNETLEESVRERTLTLENERREADLARQEAETQRQKAERANESKSNFLAKMSHEIRTPMNAVIGMSELILRENSSPAIRENTLSIKHAGTNLLAIINDILDFSKIESGKMDISSAEYLFASLLNDVIAIIRVRLSEKPILFTVNIDSSVPNVLTGDEVRLRQILLNLLTNAVKYTREGSITLKISAELNEDRSLARLSFEISDTGIGLKEENLDKLFGDFAQFDEEQNRFIEGTGLGLAITHKLCAAMGGEIRVSSVYGVGSTFTAIVPQVVKEYTPIAQVDNSESKNVLLYQTNEIYTRSVAESLENLGVRFGVVTDDEGLLAALEGNEYNFVFVNFIMFERVYRVLSKAKYGGIIVQLTKFGASTAHKGIRNIPMPAHSISIANVLNNVEDSRVYDDDKVLPIRFTAPTAQILIVDDIATNLRVAEGLLSPLEMSIHTCLSGADAVRLARENDYDIILMDHMMPDMDGVAATALIRETDGEVPVIALTANAVSGMREMFLASGFNDYLAKPIEMSKLTEIMEKWVPLDKRVKATAKIIEAAGELTIQIEGLDVKRGMEMSGGTESTYREVLGLYCRDAEERLPLMERVPDAERLPGFVTQVHALKSASGSIGAMLLSEKASYLEDAGKRGDFAAIRSELKSFCDNLSATVDNIRKALADGEDAPEAELDKALLITLRDALKEDDVESADEILDKLAGETFSAEIEKLMSDISDYVLMGDFGKAAAALEELIK
jgi:signal transduction histidine kinase/CheY-like chemotaxis protein